MFKAWSSCRRLFRCVSHVFLSWRPGRKEIGMLSSIEWLLGVRSNMALKRFHFIGMASEDTFQCAFCVDHVLNEAIYVRI